MVTVFLMVRGLLRERVGTVVRRRSFGNCTEPSLHFMAEATPFSSCGISRNLGTDFNRRTDAVQVCQHSPQHLQSIRQDCDTRIRELREAVGSFTIHVVAKAREAAVGCCAGCGIRTAAGVVRLPCRPAVSIGDAQRQFLHLTVDAEFRGTLHCFLLSGRQSPCRHQSIRSRIFAKARHNTVSAAP